MVILAYIALTFSTISLVFIIISLRAKASIQDIQNISLKLAKIETKVELMAKTAKIFKGLEKELVREIRINNDG